MSPWDIQQLDRTNSRQGKNNSYKGNRTQSIDKRKNHMQTRQKNKGTKPHHPNKNTSNTEDSLEYSSSDESLTTTTTISQKNSPDTKNKTQKRKGLSDAWKTIFKNPEKQHQESSLRYEEQRPHHYKQTKIENTSDSGEFWECNRTKFGI
jgi:hypothetical protein